MNPNENEIKLYYQELQSQLEDGQDSRGKRHDLAFVILSFFYPFSEAMEG